MGSKAIFRTDIMGPTKVLMWARQFQLLLGLHAGVGDALGE